MSDVLINGFRVTDFDDGWAAFTMRSDDGAELTTLLTVADRAALAAALLGHKAES